VRAERFREVYVLPQSFRSALIPFLAGVPFRAGMPGHARDFMLTEIRRPARQQGRIHQGFEYMDLLAPEAGDTELRAPALRVSAEAVEGAEHFMADEQGLRWIGLMPGAARGPSKRWPTECFAQLAGRLAQEGTWKVAVMGAASEATLCGTVAAAAGNRALNLAGRTSLPLWAAALRKCAAVVANDSGGMHLASALGIPVVALYGVTDPSRTGPLGTARILQNVRPRGRDIPRRSKAARLSLASIRPEQVYEALLDLLSQ